VTSLIRTTRAVAVRFCSRQTVARLIDPILSDIEVEHREASQSGKQWRARCVYLNGYVGLLKALTLHGVQACGCAVRPDEATARTIAFSVAAFIVLTIALILPPLLSTRSLEQLFGGRLALYLIPQAIPLSIPVALAFGIACGWSRTASARTMLRRVTTLGIAGSVAALATMEWLVPEANQAFRTEVRRHVDPALVHIPRGINERSLSELWTLIKQTSPDRWPAGEDTISAAIGEMSGGGRYAITRETLQLNLHVRIALCFATAMLCLLAVAIANLIRRRNLARSIFAGMILLYIAAYFGISTAAQVVPPAVSAWLPNAGLAAVSLVLLSVHPPGSRTGSPA
jgi:hypothetical protein